MQIHTRLVPTLFRVDMTARRRVLDGRQAASSAESEFLPARDVPSPVATRSLGRNPTGRYTALPERERPPGGPHRDGRAS